VHIQAAAGVVGVRKTPDGTWYDLAISGERFCVAEGSELSVGISLVGAYLEPVQLPDGHRFAAFSITGQQAKEMAEEGSTLHYTSLPSDLPKGSPN